MDVQRDTKGRIVRGYEILSGKSTTKTALVPNSGPNAGLLVEALGKTNVFTRLKDARRFEITTKGRDSRQKHRRFKKIVHLGKGTKVQKAQNYLLWGILEMMRARGYRTQYNVETVSFSHEEWTRAKARRMKPLHDVEIVVKVIKK